MPADADEPSNVDSSHGKDHGWQHSLDAVRRVVLWFPVVFVLGLLIYTYFVYVVEFCSLTLLQYEPAQTVKATLLLIFFNLLVILFLSSFLSTVARPPGSPLDYVLEDEHTASGWKSVGERQVFVLPYHSDRYCGICDTPKPERSHHCSECGRCVLKMDHHCPWFNNCIGYRNYKFFFLTLLHGALLCVFVFATLLQELIWEVANDSTTGRSVQFLVICIFSLVMGVSCLSLLVYHLYLVAKNRTTLEQLDRSEQRPPHHRNDSQQLVDYDVGCLQNIQQVFGKNCLLWPLPVPQDECQGGLRFPRPTGASIEVV